MVAAVSGPVRRPDSVRLGALGLAAVLGGAGALVLFARSDSTPDPWATALLTLFTAWSCVAAGLVAWQRRPEYRTGRLLIAIGLLWLLSAVPAGNTAGFFTVGYLLNTLAKAAFLLVLLGYPEGHLHSRYERTLAILIWVDVTIVQAVVLLFTPSPRNLILVSGHAQLAGDLHSAQRWIAFAVVAAALGLVAGRLRAASPVMRRALVPVLAAGVVTLVAVGLALVANESGWGVAPPVVLAQIGAFGIVPLAMLAGLFRSRLDRAAVADLVLELGSGVEPGRLRDALARALGDRTLQVAYWLPERAIYTDPGGRPVTLPRDDPQRAVSVVEGQDGPVAALIHDPGVREERELLGAVAAAAGMALENERLAAELRAKVEELRASRQRIVAAGDTERRRLERNLHDGAQQRLLALGLSLGLAESATPTDPAAVRGLLASAKTEVAAALEELRELARGIHPAILSDRGLKAALDGVAGRAPVPVRLAVTAERLPEPVEVAAYYLVTEAIANAVKHARAEHVDVIVDHRDARVVVEVRDDGIGGASTASGSGLRGLVDRIESLDGHLYVTSPAGGGTTIRGELPCAS
ncbi:MAG TPA: histidine kinase [Solirubrobacteraceae bacterium]|nr:histidine kinase [Solirubrobacteraceae bacterium]